MAEKLKNENKTIPDVPSAAEVAKNGVPLGETQALLLQKIEELTLYIIELNKRIELLEQEIFLLKKENSYENYDIFNNVLNRAHYSQ